MSKKGWKFAGAWAFDSAKKNWEQVFYLEKHYAQWGYHDSDATHVADRILKGEYESVAPAYWNGKCFTLIMWRDKHGNIKKSRRRDHIKQFIVPVEGGSQIETRIV